ncbi:MAG: HD domain-containing protein [Candidatus Aenigmatarchaeota archaeon]
MKNVESIKNEIKVLYANSSNECMRTWFYEGHVIVVAKYAEEISKKVGANTEIAILGALFHDIARAWGVEKDPNLMQESIRKTEEIMKKNDYTNEDIKKVKETLINHSCRRTLPKTKEGKVVATADALAHLMTDFYVLLGFNRWKNAKDYEEYQKWALEKIERDFKKKIFFKQYKFIAKKRYEALKNVFGGF